MWFTGKGEGTVGLLFQGGGRGRVEIQVGSACKNRGTMGIVMWGWKGGFYWKREGGFGGYETTNIFEGTRRLS